MSVSWHTSSLCHSLFLLFSSSHPFFSSLLSPPPITSPLLSFHLLPFFPLLSSPPSSENLYPFRMLSCDDSSGASHTSNQNQNQNKCFIANAGSRVSQKSKRNDSNEHPKCFDIVEDNEKNTLCKNSTICPLSNTLQITIPPLLLDRAEPELPHNDTCGEFDAIFLEMERKKIICESRNGSLFIPDGKMVSLKRILIVDDSMLCQKIIIKVLDGANYSFETAGNGKEACDKIGTMTSI